MQESISQPMPRYAGIAAALAVGLLGLEYVLATPDQDALRQFLVVVGIIAVATAIVFGVVVRRAVARGGSPRVALTLSLLGLLFALAFWTGLPPVLAVGGLVVARSGDESSGIARAAIGVGWLALLADCAAIVVDAAMNG